MVRVNISGTDWVLVTTSDVKKYYYNSKTKVWVVVQISGYSKTPSLSCTSMVLIGLKRPMHSRGLFLSTKRDVGACLEKEEM